MERLKNLFEPNKDTKKEILSPPKTEFVSVFGQPYLNESDYKVIRPPSIPPNVQRVIDISTVEVAVNVIEEITEHTVFEIYKINGTQVLKNLPNKSNNFKEVLHLLYRYTKNTMICNIYITDLESTEFYISKNSALPNVKLLYGHHIILYIPLNQPLQNIDEVKKAIMSSISKNTTECSVDYLLNKSVALIDYANIIEMPAFEILNGLHNSLCHDKVSLFMETSEMPKKSLAKCIIFKKLMIKL